MTAHSFALVPAAYVLLRREGTEGRTEVLLQQRANTGYRDGHWSAGAAGHIERGETSRAAAVREAREELGVQVDPADLQLLTVMQRTDGTDDPVEQRVDWFWAADRWEGTPRILEPQKCSGLAWFPLAQLPAPVVPHEELVLRSVREGVLGLDTVWGPMR
ncbi:NUDIX hydrolase [Brachybacterium hainanense]|uniref:NUDIX domain-containing protein n=1 Tax=Brachybacterium hainanense TaxID=1541174 RepID=A0ABV6RA46_9MICO